MLASCPRCHNDRVDVRYAFDREKIVRCSACGLLFLHPQPRPDETDAVYSDTYFHNDEFLKGDNSSLFGYVDYIAERFNKQPQYAAIAREIRGLLPPLSRAPRLLDVGCGLGYFLGEAFEEGFDVAGLEFNAHAVARLRRKYAFPIHAGALEQLSLDRGSFDCVTMYDVIEHLRDPFGCLTKIHELLGPAGLLVVSTPDAESVTSRLLGKRLEDFRRTREHLFFFSRRTMTEILDEHGFDVLAIRSLGHTFELGFLLERLALYNRALFTALRNLVQRLGMASLQLRVNPRTKMLVIARRRATPATVVPETIAAADASGASSGHGDVAAQDRLLIEELATLERAAPRNYQWVFDAIAPYLGKSVLEVGSGIGVISKFMVARCESLILSDHHPVYLDVLRSRFGDSPNVDYVILDLNKPPYELDGHTPDTVVCVNVLEHIADDRAVLRGFADILPQGGRVVLQVPNYPALFGSLDASYGHYRRYSRRLLRDRLERAGFRIVSLRPFNPFAIPGWIFANNVRRETRVSEAALRAYQRFVPMMRRLDFASRFGGLALIACAEKL